MSSTNLAINFTESCYESTIRNLTSFSQTNPILGRCGAAIVVVINIATLLALSTIGGVESLARSLFQLMTIPLGKGSLNKSFEHLTDSLVHVAYFLMTPIGGAYHVGLAIYNPEYLT